MGYRLDYALRQQLLEHQAQDWSMVETEGGAVLQTPLGLIHATPIDRRSQRLPGHRWIYRWAHAPLHKNPLGYVYRHQDPLADLQHAVRTQSLHRALLYTMQRRAFEHGLQGDVWWWLGSPHAPAYIPAAVYPTWRQAAQRLVVFGDTPDAVPLGLAFRPLTHLTVRLPHTHHDRLALYQSQIVPLW